MNPSSNLGPRLNSILDLVVQTQQQKMYSVIWDCCCDHGYLGINILQNNLCDKLVFVDQLAHIIEQLSEKLAPYNTGNYELITADAGALDFNHLQNNLVILAGVGVETTIQIINSIEDNHSNAQLDYIICTSTIKKSLREYLSVNRFGLLAEDLVCENNRYYEVIYVRGKLGNDAFSHLSFPRNSLSRGSLPMTSLPGISLPGISLPRICLPRVSLVCDLWDVDNEDHQRFLEKINRPRASKKPKRKNRNK